MVNTNGQLSLRFRHPSSTERVDFVVGPTNRDASLWLDRWPDWPATGTILWGPRACGKTHLLTAFLERTAGLLLRPQALRAVNLFDVVKAASVLAVDDADTAIADGCERDILHLFNAAREIGRRVVFTGVQPPVRWPVRLPDLRSRLLSCPTVSIAPPDDQMIAALFIKLFSDRQLSVEPAIIDFLVARMERSHECARRIVSYVDDVALAAKRRVTLKLVRDIFAEIEDEGAAGITPETIDLLRDAKRLTSANKEAHGNEGERR